MRKCSLILSLFLLCAFSAAVSADVFDDLSSLDKDKYVHFGAGVLVSHGSYPVFMHYCHDRKKAMWYSLGLTALLSAGKEFADSNTTGFDGGDLAAGILGGCTIFVVAF